MKTKLLFGLLLSSLLLFSSCTNLEFAEKVYKPGSHYFYDESDFLNYKTVGEGKATLVMLHGFGASLQNWNDILPILEQQNIKLVLVDLKGSGFSSKPEESDYSMEEQAKIVQDLIETLQLNNYYILGHSFGGGVALMTAINLVRANNPILPKGIILLDALVYRTEMPFFVTSVRIPIIGFLMLNLLTAEYRAEYTLDGIFYNKNKVTPEKISRYSYLFKLDGYNDAVVQTSEQIIPDNFEKYTDYYRFFNIATLILWGRQDLALPLESGIKLSKEIKKSKLVIIEECGHNPQEEQPAIVADQIIKFIKQTEEKEKK